MSWVVSLLDAAQCTKPCDPASRGVPAPARGPGTPPSPKPRPPPKRTAACMPRPNPTDIPITLAAFDQSSIPLEHWNHRAHVTVACLLLRELPLDVAIDRMRRGVQAFNARHNISLTQTSGYHETMTIAWVRIIHATMANHGGT